MASFDGNGPAVKATTDLTLQWLGHRGHSLFDLACAHGRNVSRSGSSGKAGAAVGLGYWGILASRRQGDPGKVRLPRQMQAQTAMPLTGIAQRLAPSIHQHQHRRLFGGLHHVLELPLLRVGLFELRGHFRHGLQEPQQETALHRVIHVLRQRPARGQCRPRGQVGRPATRQGNPKKTIDPGGVCCSNPLGTMRRQYW